MFNRRRVVERVRSFGAGHLGPRIRVPGIEPRNYSPILKPALFIALFLAVGWPAGLVASLESSVLSESQSFQSIFAAGLQGMITLLGLIVATFAIIIGSTRRRQTIDSAEMEVIEARKRLHFRQFALLAIFAAVAAILDGALLWMNGLGMESRWILGFATATNLVALSLTVLVLVDSFWDGKDREMARVLVRVGIPGDRTIPRNEYDTVFARMAQLVRRETGAGGDFGDLDVVRENVRQIGWEEALPADLRDGLVAHLRWRSLIEFSGQDRVPAAIVGHLGLLVAQWDRLMAERAARRASTSSGETAKEA